MTTPPAVQLALSTPKPGADLALCCYKCLLQYLLKELSVVQGLGLVNTAAPQPGVLPSAPQPPGMSTA